MIDGFSTTVDWQVHAGRVCVSGVGAHEQHGRHMPLCTDAFEAEYFARFVAKELDAALLPTLPIGTSLEQTGFRGTLTLRPETAMQVIRDLADEIETQNFDRWVIVNGHGGNFFLNPVVRDINRANRRLKIILVNFWEFSDPDITAGGWTDGWQDFHSGVWETSLMLALAPEMVGPERIDRPAPAPGDKLPLGKGDLSTFGFGYLAPEGPAGKPSLATREKGERIVSSLKRNIIPFIKDRLARLDAMPRFCGGGGIALRPLFAADIPAALELTAAAGWNQLEKEWRYFIDTQPAGMFAAVHNGRVIGTAATISYEQACAWIGMVLVSDEFRRLGIATRLMQAAMDAVAGCTAVKLDATPAGAKVYEKLGFVAEYEIKRLICRCLVKAPEGAGAVPVAAADLEAATGLDAAVFGAPRPGLLAMLRQYRQDLAWQLPDKAGKPPRAVCFGRSGRTHTQVGPLHAANLADAMAVLAPALGELLGRSVVIDVPASQTEFIATLTALGFREERPFLRMYRGANPSPGRPEQAFAICGPEFG